MYAVYDVRGSPTISEVHDDLVALLTGETDENNLVCSTIDLTGTSIAANTAAGWTLFDGDTGVANEAILRAPCVDDGAQFKYFRFKITQPTTFMVLTYSTMESWDAGTNVATNETTAFVTNLMRTPTATHGIQPLLIRATARYIYFSTSAGTAGLDRSVLAICEINRVHPCLAVGKGRVPAIASGPAWYLNESSLTRDARIPRIIDDAGTTDLTNVELYPFTTATPIANFTDMTPFANWDEDVAYDIDGDAHYGAHLLQFDRKTLIGNIAGNTLIANVWLLHADRAGATGADLGPVNDVICWLDGVGAVRVRHARWDVSGEGSPRWVFRLEDE